jgi:alpha-amylase
MAVMMQAFYWDAPKHENKEHEWWNFVAEKVEDLGKAGFNALWLPPVNKAASTTSMGYDPYDYFDLGDFDQKGGKKTWFGNKAELEALIAKAHKNGVGLYADMVIDHCSGADEEEVNPIDNQKHWTKFNPKSGIFPRNYNHFHPSRYERVIREGENYGGFPHLCHRNPEVYAAMYRYSRMLIEELGFDGFRFDYAKGFGAWMIGLLAKYQYVKNGKEFAVCGGRILVWHGGYRQLAGSSEHFTRTTRLLRSTSPCATS